MKANENKTLFAILAGIFALQLVLIFSSDGMYGGADNINHFRIARYAFDYPWLFLDEWGKPVYTALVSPFALGGIQIARIFNVLAGLATIWLTLKIVRQTEEKYSLLPVVFVAFAPSYFLLMQSCMTEILFSLVLVLAIWLFFSDRYALAAVALSFIPFVRTEGVVIIPLFIIAFLFVRKYWAIPLLLAGALFYTLVGYPHFHDWLWIYHQMPYSMGQSLYGSGSLFHFVRNSPEIFGEAFLLFLVVGIGVWTFRILKSGKFIGKSFLMYFLIVGSFAAFFAAHSYVWWKGTGGSLGLTRVIAGVVPLAAIIALTGLDSILLRIKNTSYQKVLVGFIITAQIIIAFTKQSVPMRLEPEQKLAKEASVYLKSLPEKSKIYYFDPYLVHFLELDPFNQSLSNWGVADKNEPSVSLNNGDLIVWDAHFGPNEGGLQLENLLKDAHLQLLKAILPAEPFKVLGGYDYGIYIFRKVDQKVIREKQQELTRELNFANSPDEKVELVGDKKMFKLNEGMEFSPAIEVPVSEILTKEYIELTATAHFIPKEQLNADAVLLVVSFDADHKNLSYNVKSIEAKPTADLTAQEISFRLKLNANFPEGTMLNIYVWNKDKKKLLLEDIKLIINGY